MIFTLISIEKSQSSIKQGINSDKLVIKSHKSILKKSQSSIKQGINSDK